MRDSVPSTRYSSVCNVLRQWNCHALIGPPQKQSPRTVHDDMDGPPDRLCRHGWSPRTVYVVKDGPGGPSMSSYELPSSNEDQMEFRYKHWCGRAERGRTRAPPYRRYSGGTASYSAHDPLASIYPWTVYFCNRRSGRTNYNGGPSNW